MHFDVKLNLWKLWNAFVLILIVTGSTRVKYATIPYHITNLRNTTPRITSHHMISDICNEHRCRQYNTIRAMVRGVLGVSRRLTLVLAKMIKLIWTMVTGLILVFMRTSQDHQSHGFYNRRFCNFLWSLYKSDHRHMRVHDHGWKFTILKLNLYDLSS